VIITRSPLRISLGGGGTDLPSYYEKFGSFFISAAINKYVYISVTRPFSQGIQLKYSQIENVKSVSEVKHHIIREALNILGNEFPQIEISSMADIPAGTGLGSSGSFTTALLQCLYAHSRHRLSPEELAELACKIEIEKLKEPIGKQDQYIAAFGGIRAFTISQSGKVDSRSLLLSEETLMALEENLLLFYTGTSRNASAILVDQNERSHASESEILKNLHSVKEKGLASLSALESGDLVAFAEIMHEHWISKRLRSQGMSNLRIDQMYELARANGALGGKLVGAGGGGFLLLYVNDRGRIREVMQGQGLEELRFSFDFEGTRVVLS
jgi:D-glycero-alpha-D-manno-heptose-7-phosphate kinase